MKKNLSKNVDIDTEEVSKSTNEFFYEVALYRIFPDRVESMGGKFFKTTSPYKGETCIVRKLDKEVKVMKTISQIYM